MGRLIRGLLGLFQGNKGLDQRYGQFLSGEIDKAYQENDWEKVEFLAQFFLNCGMGEYSESGERNWI